MEMFGEYFGLREVILVFLGGAIGCSVYWGQRLIIAHHKQDR